MPVVPCHGDANTPGFRAAAAGRCTRHVGGRARVAGPGGGGGRVAAAGTRRLRAAVALVVATLVAAGCLTAHDVITDRSWTLVQIEGAPPAADAGVSFGTDGRFTLDTGCNSGGGTYHLDGNRIVLDSEALTERACEGPVGGQEAGMLAVVEGRPRYEIETGTGWLRLTADSGEVLLFEAP